jgi:hypothetical protein
VLEVFRAYRRMRSGGGPCLPAGCRSGGGTCLPAGRVWYSGVGQRRSISWISWKPVVDRRGRSRTLTVEAIGGTIQSWTACAALLEFELSGIWM